VIPPSCGIISRDTAEVLRMLERIETWRMWVLCDREPVKDWGKSHTVLLGDAAHPMLQYLAQGACMATRTRSALPKKLRRLPVICRAPQSLRAGAVPSHCAGPDHGRVYGEFYHARGPAAELRNQMLSARTPEESYEVWRGCMAGRNTNMIVQNAWAA